MTVLDVEDPKEIEYILAVRYFHEYELTDDHLRVAQISLVTFSIFFTQKWDYQ